jgi:hypothetical protein
MPQKKPRFRVPLSAWFIFSLLPCLLVAADSQRAPEAFNGPGTNFLGLTTNGPAWFWSYSWFRTNLTANPHFPKPGTPPLDTNKFSPNVAKRLLDMRRDPFRTNIITLTNAIFHRFAPDSLNHLLWTNFTAKTNGREMSLWATRAHPPGWPTNPPAVRWNRRGLVWGSRGFTALSPCWEQEGISGQAPITLLTRRHGYTRGHGMGADGFRRQYRGKKVWFLAANDTLVTARISREVVRTAPSGKGDYTMVLFDKDLPASITPLRVADLGALPAKARFILDSPWPALYSEQGGTFGTMVPGFPGPGLKAGDSGSPNLLFLPEELVFTGGRGTSAATAGMQADIDELCRLEGLNPKRYQMQWLNLSGYPSY